MSKRKKIIDIKSAKEFYKELRNLVANHFNSYDSVGMLDGMTERQKKIVFEFGCGCISLIYNPIQKRYTKQERKKYDKQIAWYENKLAELQEKFDACQELRKLEAEEANEQSMSRYQELADMEKQLAEKDKEIEYLKRKWSITKSYAKDQQEAHSTYFEENKNLKQQLAEKDKQIETLRFTIDEMSNANKNIHKAFEVFDKNNRHQICEVIRDKAEYKNWSKAVPFVYVIKPELLDQIEKGE